MISGSGSDKPVVKAYQEKLKQKFGVPSDWRVASAHRTSEHAAGVFTEFENNPDYAVGGAIAGYQNALAAQWTARTTKPVYALQPEIKDFTELKLEPPDPVRYDAEVHGVLFLPPGVSAPIQIGIENGTLALAKVVSVNNLDVATMIAKYLEKRRGGVMEADEKARGGE